MGLLKNTSDDPRGAGIDDMEFVPFSDEMNFRSLNTQVMEHVAPSWVNRVGNSDHLIIADTFYNKVGPIFSLQLEAGGSVVKTNKGPWEWAGSFGVPAHCPNGLDEKGQVRHPPRGKLKDDSTRGMMPTCRVATTLGLLMAPRSGRTNIMRGGDVPVARVNET